MMQSIKVNLWWQEVQATIKKVKMSVIYIFMTCISFKPVVWIFLFVFKIHKLSILMGVDENAQIILKTKVLIFLSW